ncbi:MAG TPA: oxidative damage protection protein [Gemmatimonadales bacterium]|jgi:Fe-S cluster biosynthesis and repair protein YggX|nr:oxidative damage protection protein [Gemmatimonadales bacterium]
MTDNNITCTRCGETRQRMGFKPFQNELGQQLYDTICAVCWGDWTKTQQQLINHYALNLLDPKAKQFLVEQLRAYLLAPKEELPQG